MSTEEGKNNRKGKEEMERGVERGVGMESDSWIMVHSSCKNR